MFNGEITIQDKVALYSNIVYHISVMLILCMVLRRDNAKYQETHRFAIIYRTPFRKLLNFLIIMCQVVNFVLASKYLFRNKKTNSKQSMWMNVEAVSFVSFMIYFGIAKY